MHWLENNLSNSTSEYVRDIEEKNRNEEKDYEELLAITASNCASTSEHVRDASKNGYEDEDYAELLAMAASNRVTKEEKKEVEDISRDGESSDDKSYASPDLYVTTSSKCDSSSEQLQFCKRDADEGENCSRRVSFAPCDNVVQGFKSGAKDVDSSEDPLLDLRSSSSEPRSVRDQRSSAGHFRKSRNHHRGKKRKKCRSIYRIEPKLPPRDFPPPSPPPDASCYVRSPISEESQGSSKSQSYEDQLSCHVKKKLLALKLQEKQHCRQKRLLAASSLELSSSKLNPTCQKKKYIPTDACPPPVFHSTPESCKSFTTEETAFYTPKQSFHDYDWDNNDNSYQPQREKSSTAQSETTNTSHYISIHSTSDSSRIPSFLIEQSEHPHTNVGRDTSMNSSEVSLDDAVTHYSTADQSSNAVTDLSQDPVSTLYDESKISLVDENWWKKIERSYYDDPQDKRVFFDDIKTPFDDPEYIKLFLEDREGIKTPLDDSEDESLFVDAECEPPSQEEDKEEWHSPPKDSMEVVAKDIVLEDLINIYPSGSGEGEALESSNQILKVEVAHGVQCEQEELESSDENLKLVHGVPCEISKNPWITEPEARAATPEFRENFTQTENCKCYSDSEVTETSILSYSDRCTSAVEDNGSYCEDSEEEDRITVNVVPKDFPLKGDVSFEREEVFEEEDGEEEDGITANVLPKDVPLKGEDVSFEEEEKEKYVTSFEKEDDIINTGTFDFSYKMGKQAERKFGGNRLALLKQQLEQNCGHSDDSGDDDKNPKDTNIETLSLVPLHCATNLLESSHHSLAKSVHSLCRGAIIKQSNISLELVLPLPLRELPPEESENESEEGSTKDSSMVSSGSGEELSIMDVKLHSSIMYSPQKEARNEEI